MPELTVQVPSGDYPIHIDSGLLQAAHQYLSTGNRPVVVISDEIVAPFFLDTLVAGFSQPVERIILPAGEASKTIRHLEIIWNRLAELQFPRDGILVALGGGVVGDITGFAAATWMRGIDVVQIPTTLLAQVDASVGGKTAINLAAGKNLVGAFHQPLAVLIDTDTLATLPEREYAAGLAEIVKSALIDSQDFLDWLSENTVALRNRDKEVVLEAILRSCRLKAAIVAEDEQERGRRALLNLGHTFAHAIETALGHGTWLHGEAVAAGLVLALRLSEKVHDLDSAISHQVTQLLEAFGLPVEPPAGVPADQLLKLMGGDKKVQSGHWRLVTVATPGDVRIEEFRETGLILAILQGQ